MSIDTKIKRRAAMLASYVPLSAGLPLADGEISLCDRISLCWLYGGMEAIGIGVKGYMTITFSALKPTISFTAKKPTITFAEG